MDDGGVSQRAALEEQPAFLKRVVADVHHLPGKRTLLEHVVELEDRRLVRDRVVVEVQTGKAAHQLDFVERIFHRRIPQRVPLLHETDPQYRRAASADNRAGPSSGNAARSPPEMLPKARPSPSR